MTSSALPTCEAKSSSCSEVIQTSPAARPLTPASSTKVLTLAAATLALDEDERIITQVMQGEKEGTVVLRAKGSFFVADAPAASKAEPPERPPRNR